MNQTERISDHSNDREKMTRTKPDGTHQSHWAEWMESGISPEIAALNFRTIDDSQELDRVLNRNTDRRWKHSDQLVPGWLVQGVDPETGETTLAGCQYKPDNPLPQLDKDGTPNPGKWQKYLGASGVQADPLFLDTGDADYWRRVKDDRSVPILLSEGGKKGAAGLSHGYATIAITGVSNGQKLGRLNAKLKQYCPVGRTIYSVFDNDLLTNPNVQLALDKLGRLIAVEGAIVRVIILPEGAAKGLDDFLAAHGKEALDKLIENAMTIEEWRKTFLGKNANGEALQVEKEPRQVKEFRLLQTLLKDRLRLNGLSKEIELDGKPFNLDRARLRLGVYHKIYLESSREEVQDMIVEIAEANEYSPVVEYLNSVYEEFGNDTSILDDLAKRYFGADSPIANVMTVRTLIAAVARAFDPGCKHDEALILQGPQDYGKSSFFRILASQDWFDDSFASVSDKDEKLKLHGAWIVEWAELETIFRRRDISSTKAFLSCQNDRLRPPYGRTVVQMKRQSIIVGSTNEDEFLSDSTGNRRFWVVPVRKKIDQQLVERERDRIWSAAVAMYKRGDRWDLSDAEKKDAAAVASEFQTRDPWFDLVSDFVRSREIVSARDILEDALEIESGRQDQGQLMRIAKILRESGWKKSFREYKGDRRKIWLAPTLSGDPVLPPRSTSDLVGGSPQNFEPESVIDDLDPPVPPFTPKPTQSNLQTPAPEPVSTSLSFKEKGGSSGYSGSPSLISTVSGDPPSNPKRLQRIGADLDLQSKPYYRYLGKDPYLNELCGVKRVTIEQVHAEVALIRVEGRRSIEQTPLCDLRLIP